MTDKTELGCLLDLASLNQQEIGQELVAVLTSSGVLPLLTFPINDYSDTLTDLFFEKMRPTPDTPHSLSGTIHGTNVVFDAQTILAAFPNTRTIGASIKEISKEVVSGGWVNMMGNVPEVGAADRRKNIFPPLHYALASVLDKGLIIKSGSKDSITEDQLKLMSAIVIGEPINWPAVLVELVFDNIVKNRTTHHLIISHFLRQNPAIMRSVAGDDVVYPIIGRRFKSTDLIWARKSSRYRSPAAAQASDTPGTSVRRSSRKRSRNLVLDEEEIEEVATTTAPTSTAVQSVPAVDAPTRTGRGYSRRKKRTEAERNTESFIPFAANPEPNIYYPPIFNPTYHHRISPYLDNPESIPPNWVFPIDHLPHFIQALLTFHEEKKEDKPKVLPYKYLDDNKQRKQCVPYKTPKAVLTKEEIAFTFGKYFDLLPVEWNSFYQAQDRFVQDELILHVWDVFNKAHGLPEMPEDDPYLIGREATDEDHIAQASGKLPTVNKSRLKQMQEKIMEDIQELVDLAAAKYPSITQKRSNKVGGASTSAQPSNETPQIPSPPASPQQIKAQPISMVYPSEDQNISRSTDFDLNKSPMTLSTSSSADPELTPADEVIEEVTQHAEHEPQRNDKEEATVMEISFVSVSAEEPDDDSPKVHIEDPAVEVTSSDSTSSSSSTSTEDSSSSEEYVFTKKTSKAAAEISKPSPTVAQASRLRKIQNAAVKLAILQPIGKRTVFPDDTPSPTTPKESDIPTPAAPATDIPSTSTPTAPAFPEGNTYYELVDILRITQVHIKEDIKDFSQQMQQQMAQMQQQMALQQQQIALLQQHVSTLLPSIQDSIFSAVQAAFDAGKSSVLKEFKEEEGMQKAAAEAKAEAYMLENIELKKNLATAAVQLNNASTAAAEAAGISLASHTNQQEAAEEPTDQLEASV